MTRVSSFAPVIGAGARVLVLGSMPGRRSLEADQYYAHPRNAFWPIMAELLRFDPQLDYVERLAALQAAGVALWDVLGQCERPGSLDAAIVEASIEVNDFAALLAEYPTLRLVCFNGAKAEHSFRKYVWPQLSTRYPALRLVRLPSTSPAHAAQSFTQKLAQWQQIQQVL